MAWGKRDEGDLDVELVSLFSSATIVLIPAD